MQSFKIGILLLFVFLFNNKSLFADEFNKLENDSFAARKRWIAAGLVSQQVASTIFEYHWWWKDDYHDFQIYSDGGFNNYSLGIDKVGHFFTSYFYFHSINEVMKYGRFSKKSRRIVSIAMPAFWALSIELGDGFSSYNFSPQDLMANLMGVGFGVLQDQYPFMNNFKFKFSYFPSQYYRDVDFKNWKFVADYDGHMYWLTADMHNLLSKNKRQFWPKGLNLGIAYGVDGFSEVDQLRLNTNRQIQRKFVIGLDWNLNAIQTKKQSVKTLLKIADFVHLPAPGIRRINPDKTSGHLLLLN
jgi:hypothetical protein